MKVCHFGELIDVKQNKWQGVFTEAFMLSGGWRCYYKGPLQKRSGDLQWRIVHGAIASNVHLAHFDSGRNTECPFCGGMETVAHIFTECQRLQDLFGFLRELYGRLGLVFSLSFFVFGPGYSFPQRHKCCLVNFLFGQAKLAEWLTRRNKLQQSGPIDPLLVFRGFVEYGHPQAVE